MRYTTGFMSTRLVWRLEEGLYRDEGWSEASRLGTTGLIDYSIIGRADSSVESVEQYLRRTKGWFDGDFRLEPAGVSPDRPVSRSRCPSRKPRPPSGKAFLGNLFLFFCQRPMPFPARPPRSCPTTSPRIKRPKKSALTSRGLAH